jgi:WD40 repeat protein
MRILVFLLQAVSLAAIVAKSTAEDIVSAQRVQQLTDRYGDLLPEGAIARIGTLRLRDNSWDLAFSSDSKMLASAGYDRLHIWNVRNGKLICACPVHSSRVVFSPDGKLLASGGWEGEIVLFDLQSQKEIRRLSTDEQKIHGLAFSPDGKVLASASRTARLWEVASGKQLWKFQSPKGTICSLAFSVKGSTLATGGDDGVIRLWDSATLKEQRSFQRHPGQVDSLAFSVDDAKLVSAGTRNGRAPAEVNVWDVSTGKNIQKLKETGHWFTTVLSPDARMVALHPPGELELRATVNGNEIKKLPVSPSVAAFSADNKFLATTGVGLAIQIWDLATFKPIHDLGGHQQQITALGFAAKGKLLACASTEKSVLWEARSGKKVRLLHERVPYDPVLTSSLNGELLAVGSEEITLWNVETGNMVSRYPASLLSRPCMAFTRDSPTHGGGFIVWDVATGKETRRFGPRPGFLDPFGLPGHLPNVLWYSISVAPNGKSVITAGLDSRNSQRVCVVWEMPSGKQKNLFLMGKAGGEPVLSPDGRLLAYVDGEMVHVWQVHTGRKFQRFASKESHFWAYSLAFSPDGRTLATGCGDNSVRLWEVGTGQERYRFQGHRDYYIRVAFSPDGKMLASACSNTSALVWDLQGLGRKAAPLGTFLTSKNLEKLWADLLQNDGHKAYQAIWALVLDQERSVPFLEKQMYPVPPGDPKKIVLLIEKLADKDFAVRDQATKQLSELAERATSELHNALKRKPSLEAGRRIELLINRAAVPSHNHLRLLRGVEVLEYIGNRNAKDLLKRLAKGAPDARVTQSAQTSLERLSMFGDDDGRN